MLQRGEHESFKLDNFICRNNRRRCVVILVGVAGPQQGLPKGDRRQYPAGNFGFGNRIFLLDQSRNMHWSENLALDLLTVIVSILILLIFIMYFCSRFEKCRIILDTRNSSMKEKRLYLYRRLQDMNAGFRFVYVAGKDILLWVLPVIAIAGLLTRAFVSDGDSILLTGMYLLMFTSQAFRRFKEVKRKRKLLRRFGNAL